MSDNARRQLWSKAKAHAPLPWLRNLALLHEQCTRCGDCINACPEHIVIKGDGGFPCLDFGQGQCSFCARCVASCTIIDLFDRDKKAFAHIVLISDDCLPKQGIACQSCADVCEINAITFHWNVHRMREPQIDRDRCTACGACYRVCAPHAIRFQHERST